MSETSTSLAQLAQANEALRAQRYVEAVQRYEAVLQQAPALADVVRFNLELARAQLPQSTDDSLSAVPELRLHGALDVAPDRPEVAGWLAELGNPQPRRAVLWLDGVAHELVADLFRPDLRQHGINQGYHAFYWTPPVAALDGCEHELVLQDACTQRELARTQITWPSVQQRAYADLAGFLRASMTQPMLYAPFTFTDRQVLAGMDALAQHLCNCAAQLAQPPRVSVVMPVFNRAGLVGQAVASVLAQTYPHWELLVVDDGSTDDTLAQLQALAKGEPRIRLLPHGSNRGHAAARNTGLAAASGDWIAYLDSDNTWAPDYLAAMVGAVALQPDAGAAYSGQWLYHGHAAEPFAVRYGHGHRGLLAHQNFIDLNAFMHRRTALDRLPVPGFDVSLRRFVDHDLILRLMAQVPMYGVPVLLSHYCYDKDDNTVTGRSALAADGQTVRQRHLAHQQARWAALLAAARLQARPVPVVQEGAEAATQPVPLGTDVWWTQAGMGAMPEQCMALQHAADAWPDVGLVVWPRYLPAGHAATRQHVPYANPDAPCDVTVSAQHDNLALLPLWYAGAPLALDGGDFAAVYIKAAVVQALGLPMPLSPHTTMQPDDWRRYVGLAKLVLGLRTVLFPDAPGGECENIVPQDVLI